MVETLAEALPREIARVAEIKGQYAALGSMQPRLVVEPAVALMGAALDAAIAAMGAGDLPAMIRAHHDLKEFEF